MHTIHLLMRYFPFIGGAFAFGFTQIAIFLRRKVRKTQWYWWSAASFWFILIGVWLFFRGDKNSDEWVKRWFGHVDSAFHMSTD